MYKNNTRPLSLTKRFSIAVEYATVSRPNSVICRKYEDCNPLMKWRQTGLHRRYSRRMAGIGPLIQDWEPITIRKKAPNAATKKDEKVVNAARRSGAEIESVKNQTRGTNKAASSGTSLNTRKLDDETENLTLFTAGYVKGFYGAK